MRRPLLLLATLACTLTGVTPRPAAAQSATVATADAWADATADTTATRALSTLLAERWGVEPERVVVEWGRDADPEGRVVRVLGTGAGGVLVAELETPDGTRRYRIRAGARSRVSVAARDLERGAVLAAEDITTRDTVSWGGPAADAAPEEGWVVRRRMAAGSPLAAPAVGPPPAVTAGDVVRLVWQGGTVRVTSRATAVGTAGLGERVAVRTESGERVWGVAESVGTVRIGGARE